MAAAILTLDLLLKPPNPQRVSSPDAAQVNAKAKARELFDWASKALEYEESPASNGHVSHHTASYINDDLDMHVEIARLWQDENPERTTRALGGALGLGEAGGGIDMWIGEVI